MLVAVAPAPVPALHHTSTSSSDRFGRRHRRCDRRSAFVATVPIIGTDIGPDICPGAEGADEESGPPPMLAAEANAAVDESAREGAAAAAAREAPEDARQRSDRFIDCRRATGREHGKTEHHQQQQQQHCCRRVAVADVLIDSCRCGEQASLLRST